jgi:hypothetical protein
MKKLFLAAIFILAMFFMAVSAQAASVTLAWDASSGATGYKVFYGTATNTYSTTVNVNNVLTYTLTSLLNGTKYYFSATAYNASSESDYATEISYTTPVVNPVIQNVRAAIVGTTQRAGAFITWDNVTGAAGYKVKYGTVSGTYTTTLDVKLVNPYLIANLQNAKTYYAVVTGYDAVGNESANSAEFSFKTLSVSGLVVR